MTASTKKEVEVLKAQLAEAQKAQAAAEQRATEAEAKAAAKKVKKAARMTRTASAAQVIYGLDHGNSIEWLIKDANEHYVQAGGKDNLKESKWAVREAIKSLSGLGIVQHSDGWVFKTSRVVINKRDVKGLKALLDEAEAKAKEQAEAKAKAAKDKEAEAKKQPAKA